MVDNCQLQRDVTSIPLAVPRGVWGCLSYPQLFSRAQHLLQRSLHRSHSKCDLFIEIHFEKAFAASFALSALAECENFPRLFRSKTFLTLTRTLILTRTRTLTQTLILEPEQAWEKFRSPIMHPKTPHTSLTDQLLVPPAPHTFFSYSFIMIYIHDRYQYIMKWVMVCELKSYINII